MCVGLSLCMVFSNHQYGLFQSPWIHHINQVTCLEAKFSSSFCRPSDHLPKPLHWTVVIKRWLQFLVLYHFLASWGLATPCGCLEAKLICSLCRPSDAYIYHYTEQWVMKRWLQFQVFYLLLVPCCLATPCGLGTDELISNLCLIYAQKAKFISSLATLENIFPWFSQRGLTSGANGNFIVSTRIAMAHLIYILLILDLGYMLGIE